MEVNKMKKIGVVGLGIMGGGIAVNFLKKGFKVYVWNRTKQVSDKYKKLGLSVCGSPKEVASNVDLLLEATANDQSSKAVWLGRNGILAGATKGKILIACGTFSTDWEDILIRKCDDLGLTFFDMPLTGGRIGAETGNLTLLCGGDERKLEAIKPILDAIAKKIIYFGKAGSGIRYKLILNFLQAVHIVGFGQAMRLAQEAGLDLQKVGNALVERPGGTTTTLSWRDYQVEPEPINFSIEWITKDLNYANKMAEKINLPMLNLVRKEYRNAMNKGYSQKDWASINTLK